MKVTCKPEDKSEKDESDGSCHYFSCIRTIDNVDDDVGNIESDEYEGKKFIPESPTILHVQVILILHLFLLFNQALNFLLGLAGIEVTEMLMSTMSIEFQERRVAFDLILSILHFFDLVEVILEAPTCGPSPQFSVRVVDIGLGKRRLRQTDDIGKDLPIIRALLITQSLTSDDFHD